MVSKNINIPIYSILKSKYFSELNKPRKDFIMCALWIETYNITKDTPHMRLHLAWVRGLKHCHLRRDRERKTSHPAWVKVKSFWGHTPNAVKTQLYCAIISYCLVAIVGKELKIERTTYEILQILGIFLLDKIPVKELLANNDYKNVKEPNCNQLSISLFKRDSSDLL